MKLLSIFTHLTSSHQPLIDSSEEPPRQKKRGPVSLDPGWRKTVLLWSCLVAAVLVTNITITIWAHERTAPPQPNIQAGTDDHWNRGGKSIVLFSGSCSTSTKIKNIAHLTINILGTLLLTASANCMQCLAAPTRQEIDRAHSKGCSLDIGVFSFGNLSHISPKRLILWTLLALSSFPLHFFYNSAIFSTISANDVLSAVVSQDFESEQEMNETSLYGLNSTAAQVISALKSPSTERPIAVLDTQTCKGIYSQTLVSQYGSVALVLNITNSSQLLDYSWNQLSAKLVEEDSIGEIDWTCFDENQPSKYNTTDDLLRACQCDKNYSPASCDDSYGTYVGTGYGMFFLGSSAILPKSWGIDHCRAEMVSERCTIELAPVLMYVVIGANVVKLMVMLYIVLAMHFQPLVTAGDAIRTFLESPDHMSAEIGPVTSHDIFKAQTGGKDSFYIDSGWKQGSRRWFAAASLGRWLITMALCVTIEIAAGVLVLDPSTSNNPTIKDPLKTSEQEGFGAVSAKFFAPINDDSNPAMLSLLTNLPQWIVSTAYVLYYSLFTRMLMCHEVSKFACERKALRVSPPKVGRQRSSYFLTIPYRYSIPLLSSMALLHWFISQTLFLMRVNYTTIDGLLKPGVFSGLGWSPVAGLVAMVWGAVMILAPLLLGGIKRFRPGMPLIRQSSLALAAACHPDEKEKGKFTQKALMYGVLPTPGADGLRRVGFASLEIERLCAGECYSRTKSLCEIGEMYRIYRPAPQESSIDELGLC